MANEFSTLPASVLPVRNFLDVSTSIGVAIEEIKALQSENKYKEAALKVQDLKNKGMDITDYFIDSEFLNRMDEETRNLELFCKSRKQSVFYMEAEPITALDNDVWISGNPGIIGSNVTFPYQNVSHQGF